MEEKISELIKDEKTPQEIKDKFIKFYWLFENEED